MYISLMQSYVLSTQRQGIASMSMLRQAVLAMVLVCVPALAAAAPGDGSATAAEVENQATFCAGTYALCIKAPCSGIPTLDRLGNYVIDRALCACDVVEGVSMGPGACEDRKPVTQHGRKYLISTYSNHYNDTNRTLTCENPKTTWAWCYGAPCVVDEKDPTKATCTCPLMQSAMSTLGGNCRQDACEGIWSAAAVQGDKFANEHFYRTVQQRFPSARVNEAAPACMR
jgi:hypothetical protein